MKIWVCETEILPHIILKLPHLKLYTTRLARKGRRQRESLSEGEGGSGLGAHVDVRKEDKDMAR